MAAEASSRHFASLAELLDLRGRTAIVTGAAMGIGLGIARRLYEAGANLLIADLDEATARSVANDLVAARPDSAIAIGCDISDGGSVQEMLRAAVEGFGGVEILVNNAGIYPMVPLTQLDAATFRRVLDVNLTGLFLCTKAVSARMIEQGEAGGSSTSPRSTRCILQWWGWLTTTHPSTVRGALRRTSRWSSLRTASGSTRSHLAGSGRRVSARWTPRR